VLSVDIRMEVASSKFNVRQQRCENCPVLNTQETGQSSLKSRQWTGNDSSLYWLWLLRAFAVTDRSL